MEQLLQGCNQNIKDWSAIYDFSKREVELANLALNIEPLFTLKCVTSDKCKQML